MTWINDIFEFIGFDIENNWVFIPQLVTLFPLFLYTCKSSKVFYTESVSEHNQQGAIPILAAVYSIISVMYCYIFIKNFGAIINISHLKVLDVLNQLDNHTYYTFAIRLLCAIALLAFAFNFYKSLYTLNSLEFGILNKIPLKSIFGSKKSKAIIESVFRFLIACIFIYLEKKLGTTDYRALKPENNDALNFIENSFVLNLGYLVTLLYFALFIWALILKKGLDKEKKLPNYWYNWTYTQFVCGFLVGLIFVFIGSKYSSSFKEQLLTILFIGVVISFVLILSILVNEYLSYKNGKVQPTH